MVIKLASELRSVLRELDFDQLLDVQLYISKLLRKKFKQSEHSHNGQHNITTALSTDYHLISNMETEGRETTRIIPEPSAEIEEEQHENFSDTEEYIPTQYDFAVAETLSHSTPNADPATRGSPQKSSRSKDTVNATSDIGIQTNKNGVKLEAAAVIYRGGKLRRSGLVPLEDSPRNQLFRSRVKMESTRKRILFPKASEEIPEENSPKYKRPDIRRSREKVKAEPDFGGEFSTSREDKQTFENKAKRVNFNINPLTNKSWILEDFKLNRDINAIKRGQKKLETFYSKIGNPRQSKRDSIPHNIHTQNENPTNDTFEFTFDNLRVRSHSPPGFGRLDFPSTQERYDDKREAQRIIHEKTKYRFMKAVNSQIPPQEREFLFKREELNEIVDNNGFTWNEKELMVYPGLKKAG